MIVPSVSSIGAGLYPTVMIPAFAVPSSIPVACAVASPAAPAREADGGTRSFERNTALTGNGIARSLAALPAGPASCCCKPEKRPHRFWRAGPPVAYASTGTTVSITASVASFFGTNNPTDVELSVEE